MSPDRGLLAGGNGFIIIPGKAWLIEMKHFQVIHLNKCPHVHTQREILKYIHTHTFKSLHTQHTQPYGMQLSALHMIYIYAASGGAVG